MIALSYGQIAATGVLIKLGNYYILEIIFLILLILFAGADVNKKDQLGFSPVIHAAQFGNVFSFHHLISNASVSYILVIL